MAEPMDPHASNDRGLAAFIDAEKREGHIVDIMIEERCPTWVGHWSWPVVKPVLFSLLGYRKALRWADEIKQLKSGQACFEYLDRVLDLRVTSTGMERVPKAGRAVIVSNHPTGLADGSIVLAALRSMRTDIEIMANADACRVNPHFAEVIIPVEWVQEKRSMQKTRETVRRTSAAASLRAGSVTCRRTPFSARSSRAWTSSTASAPSRPAARARSRTCRWSRF